MARWNATKSMSRRDIKGHPAAVKKKGRTGRRRRLKAERGRGTLEKEKPPIFGMIQRTGQVVIRMLADVKQATIAPLIRRTIEKNTVIYTDEYNIYGRLKGCVRGDGRARDAGRVQHGPQHQCRVVAPQGVLAGGRRVGHSFYLNSLEPFRTS